MVGVTGSIPVVPTIFFDDFGALRLSLKKWFRRDFHEDQFRARAAPSRRDSLPGCERQVSPLLGLVTLKVTVVNDMHVMRLPSIAREFHRPT